MKRLLAGFITAIALTSPARGDDAVVGSGSGASCTESALDAGIQQLVIGVQGPGGTLRFDCGAAMHTIALTSQKFLSGQIVVDGGGRVTLDGQNLTRHLHVARISPEDRTEVTLRAISLVRGFAAGDFGGAILARTGTRLDLDRVEIRDSRADLAGGAIGIEPGDSVLNITRSGFAQNRASDGGAIATSAITTIDNSRFFGNSADVDQGGAIQSWVEDLRVENSDLRFNAAARGGAIYKREANLFLRESRLNTNSARQDGGALYVESSVERFVAFGSDFNENVASGSGGAILSGRELSLIIANLHGNRADVGGAIRILDAVFATIDNASLSENEADLGGGAIAVDAVTRISGQPNVLSLNQITTSNNRVLAGPGGDLLIADDALLVTGIVNSTLMGAGASNGGTSAHVGRGNTLILAGNLLWTATGTGCFGEPGAVIQSGGFNLGPTAACQLTQATDGSVLSFADFGLGEFANYGGRLNTFLPRADSVATDWRPCDDFNPDARGRTRPVDGNGDGSAHCDAGAVERQRVETPAALFRDGFENVVIGGGA